jgi:Leucine-rich repeat (LRR) protein
MNLIFLLRLIMIICFYYYKNHLFVTAYANESTTKCNITLNLSNMGIKYLSVNFINTNCVRKLILQNNNLEYLEEGIFSILPNLEYLDLSRNLFKLYNLLPFGGQSSLKVLILDHNNLVLNNITELVSVIRSFDSKNENSDHLENKTIKHAEINIPGIFSKLQVLSLRNIHMDTLPKNWIIYFPKLNYLDLSENLMSTIKLKFLFNTLPPTITSLILENIGLTTLITDNFNFIENLNLNHNNFSSFRSNLCYDRPLCLLNNDKLKMLSISNCSILNIDENAFNYMTNLLKLDVSHNYVSQIPHLTFNHVPLLTTLNLSGNPLYSMPNIDNLQNLTTLILNEMKIKKMIRSLKSLAYLPNLKYISLQNNELINIWPTLFKNLPMLEIIDLSQNRIKFLPSWETQKSVRQLYMNSNEIKNLEDLSIDKNGLLQLLVLKNNLISKIKITSLKELPNNDIILEL